MTAAAGDDPAARRTGTRRVVVMMGAPGAGKGTQAERLADALGLPHVSTGELFRAISLNDSELGRKVRHLLAAGRLVPDDIVVAMVEERLAQPDAAAGVILDGFPRTVAQAEALDALVEGSGSSLAVAYIEVPRDLLVARLAGRRICTRDDQHVYHVESMPPAQEGICDIDGAPLYQREDDSEETVRQRLDKQLPPMFEVVDHYAGQDVLFSVRGDRSAESVGSELLRVIGNSRAAA